MLARALLRRGFHSAQAHPKFPEGTVAGLYK